MVNISIIMPVYNVEEYLDRAIQSILHQKYENWELIIINDGSTDNSGEICENYGIEYSKIKVFHQKNAGSGAARKKGMSFSNGEYICFVDPDDYISNEALSDNVEIVKRYKPDIILNGYMELRKNIFCKIYVKKNVPIIEGLLNQADIRMRFNEIEKIGARALWNKLYKRSFLEKNNIIFTHQRVGQDALFNYDAYKYAETLFVNDKYYYTYDSLRENSAVKSFKKDRFLYEIRIANSYKAMFEFWGVENKYIYNIALSYWKAIFVELLNINYNTSPYNTSEKRMKRLKEIRMESEVQRNIEYLEKQKIFNPLYSLSYKLYTRRWDKILLKLIKFYVYFKYKK